MAQSKNGEAEMELRLVTAIRSYRTVARQCDRLSVYIDLHAKNVIDPAARAPSRFAADNLNRACGLFAPNEVLGPTTLVNGGVNQFGSGVRFA
jgi:hypothetical protein